MLERLSLQHNDPGQIKTLGDDGFVDTVNREQGI
jgi:hypothetical protein